ncbi:helix-turn-helix domain-containing protein [Kitasatospora sp. NBC_01560]|uniref:helix-turn-helix domain-containing protein n=1 Tax=Kitasatospora sp. NBC_01560 TaxID=2975965 RepID=UPI003866C290
MDAKTGVGVRVGRFRRAFGVTRAELAEAVGRNADWLKAVESGHRRLDRYAMVHALAEALGVAPADLLGLPCGREDGVTAPAHRALAALRPAVLRTGLPPAPGAPGAREAPAGPGASSAAVERLRGRLGTVTRLRAAGRLADLAAGLTLLLDDLTAVSAAPGADPDALLPALFVEALHETAMLAKRLGATDLAAVAANEARSRVAAVADPVAEAAVQWLRAEVCLAAGAVPEAAALVDAGLTTTAELLGRSGPQAWSVWGTLHLVGAVVEAQGGRQAESARHLAEAAAAVAHAAPGGLDRTGFGTGEWAVHSLHAALELGEDVGALERVHGVDTTGLPADRQARHGIDRARAHTRAGHWDQAAHELLAADRRAPQVVRSHPLVRELVGTAPRLEAAAGRLGFAL